MQAVNRKLINNTVPYGYTFRWFFPSRCGSKSAKFYPIIIIITIINDYCHENFVLKKIFQICEIVNPRKLEPTRYHSTCTGNEV